MITPDPSVNMFWAYGELSKLERLCTSSFVLQGYQVKLWTYGEITNAPRGVILRDARVILSEVRVFKNKAGSYASFSDLFRYKLLNELGGLYADTDVIALVGPGVFVRPAIVTERLPLNTEDWENDGSNEVIINNNLIYNPTPGRGNLIDLALAVADSFPPEKITWGEIGPELMTDLLKLQTEHGFEIMGPDFSNPIVYWKCPRSLLAVGGVLSPEAKFVHCYSSWWGRTRTDKNMSYPQGSLMAQFELRFGSLL